MATVAANQKIRDDYPHYLAVVRGQKLTTSPISLTKGALRNAKWLGAEVDVRHSEVSHQIQFIAEKNTKRPTDFKFKLRAPHLANEPVFRFDSDGPTHRNDLDTIPLSERQVTTPHFHIFNEDGINFAYKTDVLKSPAQAQAIVGDVNFGLAHFSSETNLLGDHGETPTVQEPQIMMPLPPNLDPVAGINFG